MDYEFAKGPNGKIFLNVALTGYGLVSNPILNKGMGFSNQERDAFKLTGIIPPNHVSLAIQRTRSHEAFLRKASEIEKYIYLRDLQDSNETLYYSLLNENITEMLPIVYTPTVGLGCQRFSHIYRRPRGIFLSYPDKNRIQQILDHPRFDHIKVIVVSDGERILGLGDQGAGGMGIPIGKLAIYSACAGIHPAHTLPILLDTGTNNPYLLKDPLYIGWPHERIRGQEYDDFIDTFVTAVKKRFPHVLLQWEDFAQQNANPILERYRDQLCTFNDDIQGTAAVAAGTLLAAMHTTKTRIREHRIAVVGAGSAGCGISRLIMQAMIEDGLSAEEARRRFYLIDRAGLLIDSMPDLLPFQTTFAQEKNVIGQWKCDDFNNITLKDVIQNVHPTLLIGVSGQPGIFTEKIVREMARRVERPIIFPLSNPTERCEATPENIMRWTEEKAIISTGSPFSTIMKHGRPFRVDQTNNCYIFPGMGLGLIATKAKRITDNMFMAAAKALMECSPAKHHAEANLLPPIDTIRDVSFHVAVAVAEEVMRSGFGDIPPIESLENYIREQMWVPEYMRYEYWDKS